VDVEILKSVNNKMCNSIQCAHQLDTDSLIFIYKQRTRGQQDRQCTYNATLKRVRATIVAEQKQ